MYRYMLSGAVILLLTITAVYGQDEPEITQEILPEIKRIGETGRLNCTVTRQSNNKVYWIHQRNQMVLTSDNSVDVEPIFNPLLDGFPKYDIERTVRGDWRTYTLIIRRLELTDAGKYTCKVLIRGQDSFPSKDGEIIVLSPPTMIQSRTTNTLTVTEGDDATLMCDAFGYPTPKISWVRPNGKGLPPPFNTFTYKGKELMLRSVKKDDRGVYRCIADNDVRPSAMYDSTLYIYFKPFARPVQTTYGQAQNQLFDIVIECRVEGFPDPNLRWYKVIKDGLDPIADDDKHVIHILSSHGNELSVAEFWFQLKIINVQANDYGDYICEGSNMLGSHRANVFLYETSECQGPNCPPWSPSASNDSPIQLPFSLGLLVFLAILQTLF